MIPNISTFAALADASRMHLLMLLREGEASVTSLVEQCNIHQSGVSRHLGILQEAGLVEVRKDGQRRLYSLRPEPFYEMDEWLESYRRLWSDRLDRFEKELSNRAAAKKGKT